MMSTRERRLRKSIVYIVGIILLITEATVCGEKGSEKPVSSKRITFTGESPILGTVRIKMQFYGIRQIRPPVRVREWGSGLPVDVAVRSIELSLGRTRVEVPARAYGNLLNVIPSTLTFREKGGTLSLYMKGGDGAEAYETRIEIMEGTIKERETIGGEFKYPQPPYERLTFGPDGASTYFLTREVPKSLSKPSGARIHLTHQESG
jgi:hypothetical protein